MDVRDQRCENDGTGTLRNPLSCVIFSNLPEGVLEDQLIEVASRAGMVASCRLLANREAGTKTGLALCEYREPASAQKALQMLQGFECRGLNLRVDMADNDTRDLRRYDLGSTVDDVAPVQITAPISSLPPEELLHLLGHVQRLSLICPELVRSLLIRHPNLSHGLLHAMYLAGVEGIEPKLHQSPEEVQQVRESLKDLKAELQRMPIPPQNVAPAPGARPTVGIGIPGFAGLAPQLALPGAAFGAPIPGQLALPGLGGQGAAPLQPGLAPGFSGLARPSAVPPGPMMGPLGSMGPSPMGFGARPPVHVGSMNMPMRPPVSQPAHDPTKELVKQRLAAMSPAELSLLPESVKQQALALMREG